MRSAHHQSYHPLNHLSSQPTGRKRSLRAGSPAWQPRFPTLGDTVQVRVASSLWVHKLFTTLELSKIQIKLEAPSNHLHKIGGSFHSNLWQVPGGLGMISLQWCRLSGFPGLGLHSSLDGGKAARPCATELWTTLGMTSWSIMASDPCGKRLELRQFRWQLSPNNYLLRHLRPNADEINQVGIKVLGQEIK